MKKIAVIILIICCMIIQHEGVYALAPFHDNETLKEVADEIQWQQWLSENKLKGYKHLHEIFPDAVKSALIRDSALRPVFMQVLPDEHMGQLEVVDSKAVDGIGGIKILQKHSAFLVGVPKIANRLVKEEHEIIVGVTDRWSKDAIRPAVELPPYNVANGRQSYFPLEDGTWLGIKGSGQFQQKDEPPYFWATNKDDPDLKKYFGLAAERELKAAIQKECKILSSTDSSLPLEQQFLTVQCLGYRRLYDLPDGKGKTNDVRRIRDQEGRVVNPVLIFNRHLHPHRMSKLPQLLKSDPGLENLCQTISGTFRKLGFLSDGESLSISELLIQAMKRMGYSEALKVNKGLVKATMHAQDFDFTGQEKDNEEFKSLPRLEPEERERINKWHGIKMKYEVLMQLVIYANRRGMVLFSDLPRALEALMKTFFEHLDTELLLEWIGPFREFGHDHPINMFTSTSVQKFHPDGDGANEIGMDLRYPMAKKIWWWAREEFVAKIRKVTPSEEEECGSSV